MNIIKKLIYVLALVCIWSVTTVSRAATIVDVYDPEPDIYVTYSHPLTYKHKLGPYGYIPGTPIAAAQLAIELWDPLNFYEKISLVFDGENQPPIIDVPWSGWWNTETYTFNVKTSLLEDNGELAVSLSVDCIKKIAGHCIVSQDFKFAQSTLTVDMAAQVPEPAMLSLLGLGLLAFAAARRRRE